MPETGRIEDKHRQLLSCIADDYEKTPGFPIYDLTKAVAIEGITTEDSILNAVGKINVDNLRGDELDRFIEQHKGLYRKSSKSAIGALTVIGAGIVRKGDLFETANGVQFKATQDTVINENGTVLIDAVIPGTIGVVGANSITTLPITLQGIVSVNNTEATIDGFDAETDESYRTRYYIALRMPATSGNKYHYQQWASEVIGVGSSKVFPLEYGDNTVEVVIIDDNKQPASDELILRVQDFIDPGQTGRGEGAAPIGAHCTVNSAPVLLINVEARLTVEQLASRVTVETDIETAIVDYLKRIAFVQNTVSYARIGDAIIDTQGLIDYENLKVNGGISNIAIDEKAVAVIGDVSWT